MPRRRVRCRSAMRVPHGARTWRSQFWRSAAAPALLA